VSASGHTPLTDETFATTPPSRSRWVDSVERPVGCMTRGSDDMHSLRCQGGTRREPDAAPCACHNSDPAGKSQFHVSLRLFPLQLSPSSPVSAR
jgi:hypothetical protein